jgi:HD-GYP domain-containing protein (c-di-GMP phosphodiesterase class II)
MNGSGYPQGLQVKHILLEARILAVADVVESIASFRPYRQPLGIGEALKKITEQKETLYGIILYNLLIFIVIYDFTRTHPSI